MLPTGPEADDILYIVIRIEQLHRPAVTRRELLLYLRDDGRGIETLLLCIERILPEPCDETIVIFPKHIDLFFGVQHFRHPLLQKFGQQRLEIGFGKADIISAVFSPIRNPLRTLSE